MSTENQEVTVEPAAEEKTETKEVKGTKRAAEVSIRCRHKPREASSVGENLLISDSIIDVCLLSEKMLSDFSVVIGPGDFINHFQFTRP